MSSAINESSGISEVVLEFDKNNNRIQKKKNDHQEKN